MNCLLYYYLEKKKEKTVNFRFTESKQNHKMHISMLHGDSDSRFGLVMSNGQSFRNI